MSGGVIRLVGELVAFPFVWVSRKFGKQDSCPICDNPSCPIPDDEDFGDTVGDFVAGLDTIDGIYCDDDGMIHYSADGPENGDTDVSL